ncbi:CU044_5270 family protein [Microbacterium sp. LWH3-1.2]|uniref:CU044_5270 family protein n=1 Tax=Microbacterium sp. LWH3-1.2 TaxID=3135256 RepID=UPI00344158CF
MDELSLLRRARTDIPERTPDQIAHGRAALFTAIEDESPFGIVDPAERAATTATVKPVKRRRRRVAAWTSFSVLGASALTITLVAVNVVGVPGVEVGADPAAASVLGSAAAATLQFSDPVVGAGQYMRVQTDALYLGQGNVPGDPETPAAFLENAHDELYVPANQEDEWVWVRCVRTLAETFGPESEAFAAQVAEDQAKYDADIIRRFPAGVAPSGLINGYGNGTTTSDDYDALPSDPTQLLQAIYEVNGETGPSRDGQAFEWIVTTLRGGTVPAEFRAALYKATAEIPDVTVTEGQATLNGKTGVAIGRLEPSSNTRRDIIIDPATGRFIGEREIAVDGWPGVPGNTIMASTAVTTTVADAAPTDTALCGSHR